MTPEIKSIQVAVEDATEQVREVVERVQETSRKTALSYLDTIERAVASTIEAARELLATDEKAKDDELVAA